MLEKNKQAELQETQQQTYTSKRVISQELEDILYQPIKVLDHGFVRVIDYMGNDFSVTQAARVSYGKGTKSVKGDATLIRYLMKHYHTSPFEMCELKLHIKCPIFVARQWVRHRTANINEYSGRYSLMSNDFYIPSLENITKQSKDNKQGRGEELSKEDTLKAQNLINNISQTAFNTYGELLNLEGNVKNNLEQKLNDTSKQALNGVAREISRIVLPLNAYTEFYWKIDLHNLLHFLNLRCHTHAQYEIRVFADIMLDIVKKWVPICYQAFMDYKKDAVVLSQEAYKVISDKLQGKAIVEANYNLTSREWLELKDRFNISLN